MDTSKIIASVSRTYVVQVYNSSYTAISFRQFTVPESYNTCDKATWYFYNRLDLFSCGGNAYPIEMHQDIKPASTDVLSSFSEIFN